MKRQSSSRVALLGMLTSVTLVLGYVEHLIPIGASIPGVKIGLSNAVLLYSLYILGIGDTFLLMALKVLLSGLLFGGVNAMMFSFAGGILSVLAMILVKRIPKMSVIGVSISGAVMHNVGQVLMAMVVLQTTKLLYYMAILMVVAVVTGLLTGIVAKLVLGALQKTGRGRMGQ